MQGRRPRVRADGRRPDAPGRTTPGWDMLARGATPGVPADRAKPSATATAADRVPWPEAIWVIALGSLGLWAGLWMIGARLLRL